MARQGKFYERPGIKRQANPSTNATRKYSKIFLATVTSPDLFVIASLQVIILL